MGMLGLQGAVRGKAYKTTVPADAVERPTDLVQRQFQADRPNQLRAADFTYVATWANAVLVAFVIDVFARRIVGCRVASSMGTNLMLDALEQALWSRSGTEKLAHHSNSKNILPLFLGELTQADVDASVGSVGDSYDSAPWQNDDRPFQDRNH